MVLEKGPQNGCGVSVVWERSGEQACDKTMEREQSEQQEGHGAGTER